MSVASSLAEGSLVMITTSQSVYNQKVWNVIDIAPLDRPDRILLEDASGGRCDGDGEQRKKVIAVRREVVHTLEVDIIPPVLTDDLTTSMELANAVQQTFNFDSSDNFEHLLDRWVPLGGRGGNMVLVRRRTRQDYRLFLFDTIDRLGLELWFYSRWAQQTILLEDWDVIKLCPACQNWPWCCWCEKFLFPPEQHRSSSTHEKALAYKRDNGVEWARQACRCW